MTPNIYRTTKIPVYYFSQIEEYLLQTNEFVSVSEFIRDSIKEKLFRIRNKNLEKRYFLLIKDIIFNEETISRIHRMVIQISKNKNIGLLKTVSIQEIVNKSIDLNYVNFLSKFLVNFAYVHPFKDGNKRVSWTAVDVFLRLNNKKLILKAKLKQETKDEIFIWQNSTNQKTAEQAVKFLNKHIIDYPENSGDLDKEINKSIKENKLLLKKLSR